MFKKKTKNELETTLFDKAIKWYMSGDSGKKAAALDLFPENMFKSEIENFKKRDKEERYKAREQELQKVLKRCQKLFPAGTIMWSDDGTDECPNILISDPYIGKSEYHVPWDKYAYDEKDRKTVLAKAIRIYHNEPVGKEKVQAYLIGLEICLDNMDNPSEYHRNSYVIDLKKYHKDEQEKRERGIQTYTNFIEDKKKQLKDLEKELKEWQDYDPTQLTKKKVEELYKKFKDS